MPRDAVSRTANVERTGRHKWVNVQNRIRTVSRNGWTKLSSMTVGGIQLQLGNNVFYFSCMYIMTPEFRDSFKYRI